MTGSLSKSDALAKHERLKNSSEISMILKKGNRLKGKAISLYFIQSRSMAFAVLVAKSVGTAVQRNKIKRWVREIFRAYRSTLPFPCTVVITINKHVLNIDHTVLDTDINRLFGKISPEGQ